jgi:hypothetical protein
MMADLIPESSGLPLPPPAELAAITLPFPKVGVLMKVFDIFIEECGGEAAMQGLTTTLVCERFLKPITADKRLSYCELKALDDQVGNIATATVFISHAWMLGPSLYK